MRGVSLHLWLWSCWSEPRSEVENASKNGVPIPDKITAARKRAEADLRAATYASPTLAKAMGEVSSRAG